MTKMEAEIIVGLAENDLNVSRTAERLPYHRNTLNFYMERIKWQLLNVIS